MTLPKPHPNSELHGRREDEQPVGLEKIDGVLVMVGDKQKEEWVRAEGMDPIDPEERA